MFTTKTAPKALKESKDSIFFERPQNFTIDKERTAQVHTFGKIELLISILKENGPLVAYGFFGPECHSELPFKLERPFCNHDIFGWTPGTKEPASTPRNVIVFGARNIVEKGYVYFSMASEKASRSYSGIRKYELSELDKKVYVISYHSFIKSVSWVYPASIESTQSPVYHFTSTPANCPALSASEREYVDTLSSLMPLESILDKGEGERKCKAIGQEIFDRYKAEKNGNSFAGKDSAQRICNAVRFMGADGFLRKQYIEHAWHMIGDSNWKWFA